VSHRTTWYHCDGPRRKITAVGTRLAVIMNSLAMASNGGDHAVAAKKDYDSNSRPTGDLRASLCSPSFRITG